MTSGNSLPSFLYSPEGIKKVLAEKRLSRYMGQHFLIEPAVVRRICAAAELSRADRVVEIGAGIGSLTVPLSREAGEVVAIEYDSAVASVLRQVLAGEKCGNVRVVVKDVRNVRFSELTSSPFFLVANIPYYITHAIVEKIVQEEPPPRRSVVMVQKEVAERMTGGKKKENRISIVLKAWGSAKKVCVVPRGCFFPRPRVDSAVVALVPHERPIFLKDEMREFFQFVGDGFSSPRKMLRNTLLGSRQVQVSALEKAFQEARVAWNARAESLAFDDWKRLFFLFRKL